MRRSEPILNVPPVVVATIAVLAIVHAVRVVLLPPDLQNEFLELFAFIPARYGAAARLAGLPGSPGADLWSFVTYSLIHADLLHLTLNAVWFLPFGSALARRIGALRFVVFFVVTAAAGAVTHLITHFGEPYPMIGASAAISGIMAAALRFAFQPDGPLRRRLGEHDDAAYHVPAVSLVGAFRDPRFLLFVIVWFGINFIFSLPGLQLENGQSIAWEAHIGGFIAGLLLFSLLDPADHAIEEPVQR